MISVRGCDCLSSPDCPYGASDCPKVKELRKMIQDNGREIAEVKESVIRLDTTIKNASKVIGALVSILIAVIGVIQL